LRCVDNHREKRKSKEIERIEATDTQAKEKVGVQVRERKEQILRRKEKKKKRKI
jgi:hypothetical protein